MRNDMRTFVPVSMVPMSTSVMSERKRPPSSKVTMLRPHLGNCIGDFEERGIATLPERRDENLLPGLCVFQRLGQHDQCMRGAAFADGRTEIVTHLCRIDVAHLGDLLIELREETRQNEVIDGCGGDAR